MDGLCEGLKLHDFLGAVQRNPDLCRAFFIAEDSATVFAMDKEKFISSIMPQYSDEGSNKKKKEVEVYSYFISYLEMLTDNGKM